MSKVKLTNGLSFLFYGFVVLTILTNLPKTAEKAHPALLKGLFSGSNLGYIIPGSEMEPFKPFLPKNGNVSWITDHPFAEKKEEQYRYWFASTYLCPLILNPQPSEKIAIVFCSNEAIANARLSATNYEWTQKIEDGKGIVIKK